MDHDEDADRQARFSARATRAWGRFKLAAVSSFAFVEAMGPVYAGKLMRDGLGFGKGKRPDAAKPRFAPSLDLDTRAVVAETVLKAMSLTEGFGRFVLVSGHGANVVNNPYASALHCGACGGYAGDRPEQWSRRLAGSVSPRRKRIPPTVICSMLRRRTTGKMRRTAV